MSFWWSHRNPTFWFIPGMLVCVLVLSGLCLFFIHRQINSEEQRLHELERLSLEQVQRLFRQQIEEKWQKAFGLFPGDGTDYQLMRNWSRQLGDDTLGFCLDDSGMLVYPPYQIYPERIARRDISILAEVSEPQFTASIEPAANSPDEDPSPRGIDEIYRRLLRAIEGRRRRAAFELCQYLLSERIVAEVERGLHARLVAVPVLLELADISNWNLERQARIVDDLLAAYGNGMLWLTPKSLSWLERIQEQCRRRNDQEAWLHRETQVWHLVKHARFAEKFLARLNLLLRRNLYNVDRHNLPLQYLPSDPSEETQLVICRFLNRSPVALFGIAIDLDRFCQKLDDSAGRASWLSPEVKLQILRDNSQTAFTRLIERRILDPWSPQFVVQAQPSDLAGFQRRASYKNVLYLATVLVSALSCILILFFGNRALKEQERLSKLRTDFITNVSHELRTPLTAIRLHAETLQRLSAPDGRSTTASVETILEETDRLNLLISDVLEFTRLENDKKRFVWEAVDLVPVIQESVRLFSHQLEAAGFQVCLELPESLVLERADKAALKQTAVNLISNSLKFSSKEKELRIRLSRNGARAIWELEDRGIGIEPQDMPYIFDKFYRGKKLDPAMSGTGLGLTLCRALIGAHGGKISVESQPRKGSRFVISLPTGQEARSREQAGDTWTEAV